MIFFWFVVFICLVLDTGKEMKIYMYRNNIGWLIGLYISYGKLLYFIYWGRRYMFEYKFWKGYVCLCFRYYFLGFGGGVFLICVCFCGFFLDNFIWCKWKL